MSIEPIDLLLQGESLSFGEAFDVTGDRSFSSVSGEIVGLLWVRFGARQ